MIDTQALRNTILDLAMRGKLVEQRPEEGTGEELYQKIQEEKARLVKEGKIKKQKPLTEITEDEKPFEIPKSWKWVKLGNIITLQSGQDLVPEKYNSGQKGIPYITGASNFDDEGNIIINRWTEYPRAIAQRGDLLLTCKGSVGSLAFLMEEKVHLARQVMGIRSFLLCPDYLKYFIETSVELLKNNSRGLIPGIERNDVLSLMLPLPPIEEQKRISSKIDSLLYQILAIDKFQKEYRKNTDVLKSKFLDMAIRGKLVEQKLEEGTGEELYQQIQKEKEKLIKEGKIKKQKPLAEITEKEKPFEIPKSWKWCRLGIILNEVIVPQRDKPPFSGNIPWCRIEDKDGYFLNGTKSGRYVSKETIKKMNLRVFPVGTVLSACSGASIGTILITTVECCTNQTFNGLVCNSNIYNWYVFWFLKSVVSDLKSLGTGSAMAYVSQSKVNNLIIPLPPLAEQKRIVAKLEELLPLCDQLK